MTAPIINLRKEMVCHLTSEENICEESEDRVLFNSNHEQRSFRWLVKFLASPNPSTIQRINGIYLKSTTIEEKQIFEIEDFFSIKELENLREVLNYDYSLPLFASREAELAGEIPTKALSLRVARDSLILKPCLAIKEVLKFLGVLSHLLKAEVLLFPIQIQSNSSKVRVRSLTTNFLSSMSEENSLTGLHRDYEPQKGMPFQFLKTNKTTFANKFINGEKGQPWLISLIIYATDLEFTEENRGLGTIFYSEDQKLSYNCSCKHGKIVLFEGDILHGISPSKDTSSLLSRVSLVYKVAFLPETDEQSVRDDFQKVFVSQFGRLKKRTDEARDLTNEETSKKPRRSEIE